MFSELNGSRAKLSVCEEMRGYMKTTTVAAKGRFVLSDTSISRDGVWADLTSQFSEYPTWHPSYAHFEPVSQDSNGKPYEFEAHRYGIYLGKILYWNDAEKILKFSIGPERKTPANHEDEISVETYEYRIMNGVNSVIIDIKYNKKSNRRGILRFLSLRQDAVREIKWIMRGIPFSGNIDYVGTCKPESV
jgi:hypothetical protein